ncbi:hypothetical protein CERSUDRAFT_114151 [Gelatoporia subvermispora B]|uniref:UbiA prenyltransferase n=1 Tax=Ceriporiopsis subvermispora (strain B) TaxID=914234 RepID=M2QZB7_CERS8|nr:hypothetical protein CERSUDRAFT_114151 [Gelatoporia subvermispora B]
MAVLGVFRLISHWLHTLFLFTKSDIKTTVIPVSLFAAAAAPAPCTYLIVQSTFWIWLHVLQFDVSNQTLKPEEDEFNKHDRPLPSRRLTIEAAYVLRWMLVPICWLWSAMYSVKTFYSSVALVALTILYNECAAHAGHWLARNCVNAAGFAAFETGATLVANMDHNNLDNTAILSICISAGIFTTTIHTQDFKDIQGDRMIGRRTLPIVHTSVARPSVVIGLCLWSLILATIWDLRMGAQLVFHTLSLFVSYRFMAYGDITEDQVSFYWYNVWLSIAHAQPGYYRYLSSRL